MDDRFLVFTLCVGSLMGAVLGMVAEVWPRRAGWIASAGTAILGALLICGLVTFLAGR